MIELPPEVFEDFVAEALQRLPQPFRELMENVGVVVEGEPSPEQLAKQRIRNPLSLFGLYEGVPQSRRGVAYSGVLPDKISIFRRSIEYAANSPAEARQMVYDTVWHEVAHHFGMDERRVRQAEVKRRTRH